MFNVLLESRARRARQRGGAAVSVLLHTGLILFAVVATAGPVDYRVENEAEQERLIYTPTSHATTPRPSPTPSPSPRRMHAFPATPPAVVFNGVVPVEIPPVSEGDPPALVERWTHAGGIGASAFRRPGTGIGSTLDGVPFESGVDKPAIAVGGNPPPRYPDVLRQARIEGSVTIQVVVDTTGRAEMATLEVVSSDHALFESAVLAVLPRYRFVPAVSADRRVRMWVIVPFVFEMRQ